MTLPYEKLYVKCDVIGLCAKTVKGWYSVINSALSDLNLLYANWNGHMEKSRGTQVFFKYTVQSISFRTDFF